MCMLQTLAIMLFELFLLVVKSVRSLELDLLVVMMGLLWTEHGSLHQLTLLCGATGHGGR